MKVIFVVDDSLDMRLVNVKRLETLFKDAKIHEFSDGLSASMNMRRLQPQLIVTDLHMDRGDGDSVVESAKIHCPNAKIVLFTSSPEDSKVPEKFNKIIDKSWSASQFCQSIMEVVKTK